MRVWIVVWSFETSVTSDNPYSYLNLQELDKLHDLPIQRLKWMTIEQKENFEDYAVYTVEIPTKEQNTPECNEAKYKEIENLVKFDVFEEVDDGPVWSSNRLLQHDLWREGIAWPHTSTHGDSGLLSVVL